MRLLFFSTLFFTTHLFLASESNNNTQPQKRFLHGHPILNNKAYAAILALKNLPTQFPPEINRIIALHFVWENLNNSEIWSHLFRYGNLDKCKEGLYTDKELFCIAYEFISDECHDTARTQWLIKLFKRIPIISYTPTAVNPQVTDRWILNLDIPTQHSYPKITESELCYDFEIHQRMQTAIKRMTLYNTLKCRKLSRLLSSKANPKNALIHQAIILATENNHFNLLYKLSTDYNVDLSKVRANFNRSLLYFVTSPEMVDFLVAYGLNIKDVGKYTSPLLSAFYGSRFKNGEQQVATVQKLLEKDAIITEDIKPQPCERAYSCGCSLELYRFLKEKF